MSAAKARRAPQSRAGAPEPGSAWCWAEAGGAAISVLAQPKASCTEIVGIVGAALKIRIAAPPVDGEANDALVRFLAKALGVPRSQVSLRAGASGRHKTVFVTGVPLARVLALVSP